MAAELAETDRQRRDLVANVSHELRTPIAALQVQLENLVDGVSNPDPATFRVMLAQVERLGRLVKQLLDLSRLESGAVPLERSEFRGRAAARARRAANSSCTARRSRSKCASSPPTSPPTAIPSVCTRSSPTCSRTRCATRRAAAPSRCRPAARATGVVIEVLDEGPGIPDDERARVFERFYRADAARAVSDGGAGLGLAIARWIVDLHGGDIHPEPRQPQGCRMVVTLPIA